MTNVPVSLYCESNESSCMFTPGHTYSVIDQGDILLLVLDDRAMGRCINKEQLAFITHNGVRGPLYARFRLTLG